MRLKAIYTLLIIAIINTLTPSNANATVPIYSEMYMYDNQDCYEDHDKNINNPVEIPDPIAPVNKQIFYFNWMLDTIIVIPAAEIYKTAVPKKSRAYINNFMTNISEPINFINLIFQGKFKQSQIPLARFMTNSLLGFFGIMDVASEFNLKYISEDFGRTLAYYNVPRGPYLVAPILGPTSLRDLSGKAFDFFIDPVRYTVNNDDRFAINTIWLLQKRVDNDLIIKTIKDSIDPYETAKQIYTQNRNKQLDDNK